MNFKSFSHSRSFAALVMGSWLAACAAPPSSCPPPAQLVMGMCMPCANGACSMDAAGADSPSPPSDVAPSDGTGPRDTGVATDSGVVVDGGVIEDVPSSDGAIQCAPPTGTRCNNSCVDTSTSTDHCGMCGNTCIAPANGTASCAMGTCGLAMCNMGFANCDMSAANGCEINVNNDVNHCGGCGQSCSNTNAVPACNGRSCAIRSCSPGFGDCDMSAANGCEINVSNSVMHCGRCGNTCNPAANSTAACTNGGCAFGACLPGFANCDNNVANGCEIATGTSVNNCGACGNVCPAPAANGSAACMAGACRIVCNAGFEPLGGRCIPVGLYARPIVPMSLGDVTQLRPTFRWELPAGVDGVVLDLCRDRACTMVIESQRLAAATTATASMNLPRATVVFWRTRVYVGAAVSTTSSPVWLFHTPSVSASSAVNSSANPHVDVNGDGYDDILMGLPGTTVAGRANLGSVRVYHGGPAAPNAPAFTIDGAFTAENFGEAVAGVGDVNGDGYGDVVIGARNCPNGGSSQVGRASLYYGSAMGLSNIIQRFYLGAAAFDHLGDSVGAAGDVNLDGYADFLVGIPDADLPGQSAIGSAWLILGTSTIPGPAATRTYYGVSADDNFGSSVATVGDLNGDGASDFAIGAVDGDAGPLIDVGTVSVYHGAVGSTPAALTRLVRDDTNQAREFGNAVSSAGDVNNDGYSDLLVGDYYGYAGPRLEGGFASVFHGGAMGLVAATSRNIAIAAAGDHFGASVASARDVNGDGYGDIVVGAPLADSNGMLNTGMAGVFLGSAGGTLGAPQILVYGDLANGQFGSSVAGTDHLRDNYGDVVIGSPGRTGPAAGSGALYYYNGFGVGITLAYTRRFDGAMAMEGGGTSVAALTPRVHRQLFSL